MVCAKITIQTVTGPCEPKVKRLLPPAGLDMKSSDQKWMNTTICAAHAVRCKAA